MIAIAAWLKWHQRRASAAVFAVSLIAPIMVGPALEMVAYRAVHDNQRESILSYTLIGRGEMVIRQDATFSGPHATELAALGKAMYAIDAPVREFLSAMPSLAAWPVWTAAYEAIAQSEHFLEDELIEASDRTGLSPNELRSALGMQSILGNIPGYIKISLIHYLGQWSITALRFPPVARTMNAYVATHPVPMREALTDVILHPTPARSSLAAYPAFLIAGVATFVLGLGLIAFIVRPSMADASRPRHDLMLACFFAATAQSYTLLISLINVSTPRFLMAVYPDILLAALFSIMAAGSHFGWFGRR